MDRTSVDFPKNEVYGGLKKAGNIIELFMGDFPWPGLIAKGLVYFFHIFFRKKGNKMGEFATRQLL